jgi:streptogramin lyase
MAMRKGTLFARTFGVALLGLAFAGLAAAAADSPSAALAGKVTSQAEGPMEGVLIGAKKAGSTISVWVVSNAQGQYTFPRDRMEPGKYSISIRAVGYVLPKTSVDVSAQPTTLDLQLDKVTSASKLARQLSNGEWLMSVPGTDPQKRLLGGCVNCHTLERVMFSRFDADEMTKVAQRMGAHANNSSTLHPWFGEETDYLRTPDPEKPSAVGTYLSSINLSAKDTFDFPLKALPRPKGKATQVIYTVYDLPRFDASPHDVVFDAQGNAWYSDFNSQFIGKIDLKTGKTTEYKVPQARGYQVAEGGLQIDIDKQGRLYFGNMFQMQIARFDSKTEKWETFRNPLPEEKLGDGHLTMIDPAFQDVDGKIWANVAAGNGEAGGTWHIDLAHNEWTHVTYPPGSPPARAYDVIADANNDMYGVTMTNPRIWKTDGKTLKTVWWDFPAKGEGCRRGHLDAQGRVWCGDFNGNRLGMFDPKTEKVTEWEMPTPWTRPYDAQYDDKGYAWTAGMDNDLAVRLNVQTGEFVEYLVPHETNVRHVEVLKTGPFSSMWLPDQHGGTITRIEPLAP